MLAPLPFLDLSDPQFSTRGETVYAKRATSWGARTPYGIAVLQYHAVGQIIRDRRFRQGSHNWPNLNGLTGPFSAFWSRSIIGREGADHRRLRDIVVPTLSADFIASMNPAFCEIASDLCANLRQSDTCEFQAAFAIPFAGQALTTLLGMDRSDWVSVSSDASDLGLAMGVNCKAHEPVFDAAYTRLHALAISLVARVRQGFDTTSFVARLVARFDADPQSDPAELYDLIVISIFGAIDTTRSQLGLGMSLFVENPAQWQLLRADETLIEPAIAEFIRVRPTTTWVTRQAIADVEFEGYTIAAGTVLHLLVHASASDPLICDTPDFDITKKRKPHFGFGGGAHHCIGHLMARTDMAAALRALVNTFATLQPDGDATWLPDSGNTSPITLPIRYTVADSVSKLA
jgi:cytochrome P450